MRTAACIRITDGTSVMIPICAHAITWRAGRSSPRATRLTSRQWRGARAINRLAATSLFGGKRVLRIAVGKRRECLARQPVANPFALRARADRFIEADRGFVPVEHTPFESPTACFACNLRKMAKHLFAGATAARCRRYVQVFQIKPLFAEPCRIGEEVNAKADRLAVHFADQSLRGGCGGEKARFGVFNSRDNF